jgi:hypothetical protein
MIHLFVRKLHKASNFDGFFKMTKTRENGHEIWSVRSVYRSSSSKPYQENWKIILKWTLMKLGLRSVDWINLAQDID